MEVVDKTWRLTIRDGFWQTETTALIGTSSGQQVKPGSVGRPLPGHGVALLDSEGAEVSEVEIALKPRSTACGIDARLYRGIDLEPVDGAYCRTGDIASRDENGWIT